MEIVLNRLDEQQVLEAVLASYTLPRFGVHGISHWARVMENGLRLAARTGADRRVIRLFALLHDARRQNESIDPGHGRRAAEWVASLHGSAFELPAPEFELLLHACRRHTDGLTEADVTVQTCWDADRLDLGRVGITPVPGRLCTEAARDPALLDWAYARSVASHVPGFVAERWLVDGWEPPP